MEFVQQGDNLTTTGDCDRRAAVETPVDLFYVLSIFHHVAEPEARKSFLAHVRHESVEATDVFGVGNGDRIADGPGNAQQRLQGIVAGPAPVLPREGPFGRDEDGLALGVQKVRSFLVVRGNLPVGTLGCELPRQRRGNRHAGDEA